LIDSFFSSSRLSEPVHQSLDTVSVAWLGHKNQVLATSKQLHWNSKLEEASPEFFPDNIYQDPRRNNAEW
jgi:hypothetical protein